MQLSHDPTEKGSYRDEHGFVAILKDGSELARDNGFQHNVNYHDRDDKTEELMAEVLEKIKTPSMSAAARPDAVISSSTLAAAAV